MVRRSGRSAAAQAVASGTGLISSYPRLSRGARGTEAEGMEKIPLTAKGFAKLDAELRKLKSVERPAVIAAIAEAREHGDLSENAEYHAARERQSFIEGRIRELEAIIGRSEVIDASRLSGPIKFGATVVLLDEDTDEEKTYQIVGEQEASIEEGLLNLKSPLARALIGKEPGDSVEVRTPGGVRSYEIRAVSFQ
jgi:transcription elongation factor GreA